MKDDRAQIRNEAQRALGFALYESGSDRDRGAELLRQARDTTEEPEIRTAQVNKRARKLTGMASEINAPVLYGPPEADVTYLCWGSTLTTRSLKRSP